MAYQQRSISAKHGIGISLPISIGNNTSCVLETSQVVEIFGAESHPPAFLQPLATSNYKRKSKQELHGG